MGETKRPINRINRQATVSAPSKIATVAFVSSFTLSNKLEDKRQKFIHTQERLSCTETFVNENTQHSKQLEQVQAPENTTNRGELIGFVSLTSKKVFTRFLKMLMLGRLSQKIRQPPKAMDRVKHPSTGDPGLSLCLHVLELSRYSQCSN